MSIFRVNKTDYQSITLSTEPSRYYISNSSGIDGFVNVYPRRSKIEKDISESDDPSTPFIESNSLFKSLESIKKIAKKNNNIFNLFLGPGEKGFLKDVNNSPQAEKNNQVLLIDRFIPTTFFTSKTSKKTLIKDNLSNYYRTTYPSANWAYPNYHSLNFFSSENLPTSSVLLYANDILSDYQSTDVYTKGRYSLTGAFSFDFYINPRYNQLESGHFKAGTIFHLSSSYAISLITGSQKNVNGLPSAFRLQLQLSHSADIPPSEAVYGTYPRNLIFLSDDNSLQLNNWHHVIIRWGTNTINQGTGSFNIDGIEAGTFNINSASIAPLKYNDNTMDQANPDALCIGNFYEGKNIGNDRLKKFFTLASSRADGVKTLDVSDITRDRPTNFKFSHPLQAELHDLSIKKEYLSDLYIEKSSSLAPIDLSKHLFYLPPFFTMESPIRIYDTANLCGGVFQTPAILADGMTTTPFNVAMAYGVDGHYINTENFLKDFSSNHHPKQIFLSASKVNYDNVSTVSANQILYDQPSVRKRNLLILPCDDGNFYPNYELFTKQKAQSYSAITLPGFFYDLNFDPKTYSYVDDLGVFNPGLITLNFQLSSSLFPPADIKDKTDNQIQAYEKQLIELLVGFSPDKPLANEKSAFQSYLKDLSFSLLPELESPDAFFVTQSQIPLSITNRTKDFSSNQITVFSISNLYYGNRISPGSFTITDSSMSGSDGKISITIKDDGIGGLYRADSITQHCKWNSVGSIFYNEGIICIKNPHLYFFGKHQYEMSFKGDQNLHILSIETIAPFNHLNSSSNPSFSNDIPSTLYPNERDKDFVYITGINFHDNNLNVIMKTQLAQPIMKRHSEKIMFKVKYDF